MGPPPEGAPELPDRSNTIEDVRDECIPVAGTAIDEGELDWNQFRIAVVDDNHINTKILAKYLNKLLNVTISPSDIFTDGLQCLEAMKTVEYDLILLDIEMPILDGCETTVCIRTGMDSPTRQPSGSIEELSDYFGLAVPPTSFHHSLSTLASEDVPSPPPSSPTSSTSHLPPLPTSHSHPSLQSSQQSSSTSLLLQSTQSHASNSSAIHPSPILPTNRTIPIIAVTCNALDHHKTHYFSIGVDDVVAKPIQANLLAESVKKALRRRNGSNFGSRSGSRSGDLGMTREGSEVGAV
ncbi:hypothetical protein HDV00_005203 [Rhizophlyctis rosea]|nr:hypothetical protein HDV00_005203 [Rhizophlyctis rosea]